MTREIDFKYCPKCAAPLLKQTPILLICSACDLHFYINPRATNAIILQNSKNQLLLTKRKFDPHAGKYDLPGGFIDINESVEESVIRELKEELNIDMNKDDIEYLGSCTDTYEFKGVGYYTVGMIYKALVKDDIIITPSDDVESTLWVNMNDIPYDDIAFEGVKIFMKSYFSSTT
ncbi:MAG: NUDIX domain-containing protein [bacterium]|nr:NUDIX domain-containing protein [bacterium]